MSTPDYPGQERSHQPAAPHPPYPVGVPPQPCQPGAAQVPYPPGISVKNVTKKAHLFHADGTVTAQDATGREYEADGEANIYGNTDGAGFLDEINPGNAIRGYVYFDVPKGTKLTTITLMQGCLPSPRTRLSRCEWRPDKATRGRKANE